MVFIVSKVPEICEEPGNNKIKGIIMKIEIDQRAIGSAEKKEKRKNARLKKSALFELAETAKREANPRAGKAEPVPSLLSKTGKFAAK